MVLKPFMLRRVKRDVETELGEKIEVQIDCSLASRQRTMYQAIKSKVRWGAGS
jgi:DNA helicase INO80